MTRHRQKMQDMQTRRLELPLTELRFVPSAETGGAYQFEGYAVLWSSINSHNERFERGAFADLISLKKPVHMYYNHGYREFFSVDWSYRIGKWVEMVEDDIGLFVRGELTAGLDLSDRVGAMMQHGTVDGLSVGFFEPAPMDVISVNGVSVIKRVDLYEISVVDEPSDRTARAAPVDAAVANVNSQRDATDLLQTVGFSADGAAALLARLDDMRQPTAPPLQIDGLTALLSKLG
jgi:HK97 family phage prohead protease